MDTFTRTNTSKVSFDHGRTTQGFFHGQNQAAASRDFLGLKSSRNPPQFLPGKASGSIPRPRLQPPRRRFFHAISPIPTFPLTPNFLHPISQETAVSSPDLPHETRKTKFLPFSRKHRLRQHLSTNFASLRVYFSPIIHPRKCLLLLRQQAKRRHHIGQIKTEPASPAPLNASA